MKRLLFFVFAAVFCIASLSHAAEGSCTFAKVKDLRVIRTWVCTADSGTGNIGSASAATITGTGYDEAMNTGLIRWVELTPGSGGDAPSAITTAKILTTDDATTDFAGGLFSGASTTTVTAAMPLDVINGGPMEVNRKALTIQATGIGAGNVITIRMISDH